MHEDGIVNLLNAAHRPLSIGEVRQALARDLGHRVPYETTKRDLLTLAAKGLIECKSIGTGKRVSWIFWSRRWDQRPGRDSAGPDPFDVPIAERDSMSPEEVASLYDRLVGDHADLVRGHLGRGSRYVVLCDGNVVDASSREPSDEDIKALERELGKVCYVLTEDLIEESPWAPLGEGDYYPSIGLFIGGLEWEEGEVFGQGLEMIADLDTGNPDVAALSNEDLSVVQRTGRPIVRRAFHLGRHYDYCLRRVRIGIRDAVGATRCMEKACRGVFSWGDAERNPFLLANPKRKGLVGRDLLLSMSLSLELSGRRRSSRVLLE